MREYQHPGRISDDVLYQMRLRYQRRLAELNEEAQRRIFRQEGVA